MGGAGKKKVNERKVSEQTLIENQGKVLDFKANHNGSSLVCATL